MPIQSIQLPVESIRLLSCQGGLWVTHGFFLGRSVVDEA